MTKPAGMLAGLAAERYERWFGTFMTPMAEVLLEAAGLEPGQDVLDVACGTGFVTRLAAEQVGAEHVIGVDINPGMLAVARRCCPRGVAFAQASADRLPCTDAVVEVVVCQQGMQHFPDRSAAFSEFARVLRPGGRLVTTVWNGAGDNPLKVAQIAGIRASLSDEIAGQVADTIAEGSDRWLAEGAAAAGLGDVTVRRCARVVTIPAIAEYVRDQVLATRWGSRLAEGGPGAEQIFVREAMAVLERYVCPDGAADVPFTAHLLLARRP